MPAGSTRLVPDVALESDTSPGNYVVKNGSWFIVGGTSGAAPQWAGFFAQLNQKLGGNGLGNPGTRLYGLCGTAAYHDVTSGSNGDYTASPGYDLVTGLGTIHAQNFFALSSVPGACGDVNGDGVVNIGDALLVAKYDVGGQLCGQAPFLHPERCDVNLDGRCDIGDALRIAQCDVGAVSCQFACGPFTCP